MITKYNVGDSVLVPASIRSISEENGRIVYELDTPWSVPEEVILPDENGKQNAKLSYFRELRDTLLGDSYRL
jgi:hypothetical protein